MQRQQGLESFFNLKGLGWPKGPRILSATKTEEFEML
jgi:hypothetical protein